MSEAIIADQIMNELKAIRKDIEFLKDHMVDVDCIMTEDDYLALKSAEKKLTTRILKKIEEHEYKLR
ncbi:MAG: hypothetical protein Q8M95_11250 [Candidatus Methanoperedens sp.]|nr:hypothetical protein [Candidatus Methanoperedens sp.]